MRKWLGLCGATRDNRFREKLTVPNVMDISIQKLSATSSVVSPTNLPAAAQLQFKMDSATNSDRQLLNLRDLTESDRTTMIEDTVEKAVSMESKHTVECLLGQVCQLSPMEKLLLYLKLPNGRSTVDPLRQNLNPLGSRQEIHHTITWIKTHLQEDPEVSLPKQDVYEQYMDYCQGNSVKPLSTADFGKVMKQVYPNVRPRRLGTRGHSRYCYAGLRKRIRLAPPVLPDLGPSEKTPLESNGGGKVGSPEHTLFVAVSVLIREWAGKTLGIRFSSLQDLACHLVQSTAVNAQSTAALTVLSSMNNPTPRSAAPSRPTSSVASLGSDGRPPSDCSAGPSRPASETPRSSIERDHKRKILDDAERSRPKGSDNKLRGKRTKHRSSSSPLDVNFPAGRRSNVTKAAAPPTNPNCDNSGGKQNYLGVSYMNTKNGQADVQNNNTLLSNGSALQSYVMPVHSTFTEASLPESTETKTGCDNYVSSQRPDGGLDGKLPIPRLPKANKKQAMQNYIVFPPPTHSSQHHQPLQQLQQQSPVMSQKQKYKPIKPKPFPDEKIMLKDDEASKQLLINSDIESSIIQNGAFKSELAHTKGGNDAIIGCLEKDALDDYLHGGSNSQEQEEELMQYFPQQHQGSGQNHSMQVDAANSFDKISQLRLLLERNMNQDMAGKATQYQNGLSAAASLSLLSQRNQQKQNLILPSLLAGQQKDARRVSFEVPVDPDSANNSVPPSPNTKQRFSFTPISPRPCSPTKASSANASPFVSPRNTPIPRRMSYQPTTTYMQPLHASMYPGKPLLKGSLPRTIMRSMSVNSEAESVSPFQSVNYRPYVSSTQSVDAANQLNMDIKPDVNSLQDFGTPSNAQSKTFPQWNRPSQNLISALPPLQLSRPQHQVSMSAPQSPVIHPSRSLKRSGCNFRKESRAHSFDMESSNILIQSVDLKTQPDSVLDPYSCGSQVPSNISDKYSQELCELFPEDAATVPLQAVPSMSHFRSQSVPLRRMVNSAAVSPMPPTALPSPHYGQPPCQQQFFNFNPFTPSSSVAPTPVPSEVADFGVDPDIIQQSPVSNNLQDMELMPSELDNCCTSQADSMTTETLNPDLLNEMFRLFDEGKNDAQHAAEEFPHTPEQYKPDPETTLRGDPLFSSFRLQAVGQDCVSCPDEQLALNGKQSAGTDPVDPILNELSSIASSAAVQPDMSSLLEDTPSSFITEDLECEISQLTREVGNSSAH